MWWESRSIAGQWLAVVGVALAAILILDLLLVVAQAQTGHPITAAVAAAADAIRAPFEGLLPASSTPMTTAVAAVGYGVVVALGEAVRRAGMALLASSTSRVPRIVAQTWLAAASLLALDAVARLAGANPARGLGWVVAGPAMALRWPTGAWLRDDAYLLATVLAIALWGAVATAAVARLHVRTDTSVDPPSSEAVRWTGDTVPLIAPAPPTTRQTMSHNTASSGGDRDVDRTSLTA